MREREGGLGKVGAKDPVGSVRLEVDDGRDARLGDLEAFGNLGERSTVAPETTDLGVVVEGSLARKRCARAAT